LALKKLNVFLKYSRLLYLVELEKFYKFIVIIFSTKAFEEVKKEKYSSKP
jgi:hypothetical protein